MFRLSGEDVPMLIGCMQMNKAHGVQATLAFAKTADVRLPIQQSCCPLSRALPRFTDTFEVADLGCFDGQYKPIRPLMV